MTLSLRDRAKAATSALSITLKACTIIIVVGTALFIIALGIALGVGFGVGGRTRVTHPVTLAPPIFTCDQSAACGCATTQPVFSSRILNGQTAAFNSWPWIVYLTNPLSPRTFCTGFIISERFVLTSTLCVAQYGFNVTVTVGATNFQSLWGGINVTNSTSITNLANGISIVTLMTNLTYNSIVKPCCLTTSLSQPAIGTHGVIAGWGETSANAIGTPAMNLQQAVVQVVSPNQCGTGSTLGAIDTMLCASFNSVAACPIDAGGPLMVNMNNRWTCVGVITKQTSCQNQISFVRIAPFFSMINNITGIYNFPWQLAV